MNTLFELNYEKLPKSVCSDRRGYSQKIVRLGPQRIRDKESEMHTSGGSHRDIISLREFGETEIDISQNIVMSQF